MHKNKNLYFISVIIPVYNAQEYLNNCIKCLINQDFKEHFEIIIVDDCSSDLTPKLIKNLNLKNLKNFHFKKNKGQAAARNFGLKKAQGKYVYFMDVDDKISINSLKILFEEAKKNNYDYIFSDFKRIEDLKNQRINKYNYYKNKVFSNIDITSAMIRELHDPSLGHLGLFGCNGRLIRRKILIDNGIYFDEKLRWLEDKIFSWDIFRLNIRIKYIRKQLYFYHVHSNVLSTVATSLINGNPLNYIKVIIKHVEAGLKKKITSAFLVRKFINQALVFFSIQILVSISRSIALNKLNSKNGKILRKKIILKLFSSKNFNKAVKFYSVSKKESSAIPKALRSKKIFLLQQALELRAQEIIKIKKSTKKN